MRVTADSPKPKPKEKQDQHASYGDFSEWLLGQVLTEGWSIQCSIGSIGLIQGWLKTAIWLAHKVVTHPLPFLSPAKDGLANDSL